MKNWFLGKCGVFIVAVILLSLMCWDGLQGQTMPPPIVRGPFYVAFGAKRVAILPLAEHSHQESFSQALNWGGNEIIVETVRDYLVSKEIVVSNQVGVSRLLISMGIIKLFRGVNRFLSFDRYLIKKTRNPLMVETLTRSLARGGRATVPLSTPELKELGRKLGIDVVIRGRITEKEKLKFEAIPWEKTPDPFSGVSPFKLPGIDAGMMGYGSPGYEEGLHSFSGIKPIHLIEGYSFRPGWTVLQIRLYFQNVNTGEVGWSNEVKFACPTGSDGKTIEADLRKAITALMDDLFINYLFYYKGDWLCLKERR